MVYWLNSQIQCNSHLMVLSGIQDSIGDSELLEGGENMELGEGEGESPFQHLVLTDIIPETPPSSQECVINDEREDREKDRNRDDSVSSSTIVLSSQDTLNNSVAACNDRDSMNIVESARTEDTVICTPMNTEKPQKQAATDLNSELAGSATADYLSLETGSITIRDGGEGEPLDDDVIDENEEGDVEEEGSAAGVESVEVKQEPLEEEETEPQKWYMYKIRTGH